MSAILVSGCYNTSVSSTGLDKKIRMEVNALDYMTGRVLSMECEDGK